MATFHFHNGVVEHGARQPKIAQANLPVGAHQEVRRLEVAVNDPAAMREGQALGHLGGQIQNDLRMQRRARLDAASQAALFEIWHHEIRPFRAVGHFLHRHNVGMPQAFQVAGFLEKTVYHLLIGHQLGPDHFHRHVAARLGIARQQDNPHAAAAQ